MIFCISLQIVLLIWPLVECSHFHGATFSWAPTGNGYEVEVKYRISWKMSSAYCDDSVIASGQLIGPSVRFLCYSGCTGNLGTLQYQCTDYNVDEYWSSGLGSAIIDPNVPVFEFVFDSCCWVSDLVIGGSGDWSLKTKVDLSIRPDLGISNTSPVVAMPPVVRLQDGCDHTILLPVADIDGDFIRCRWSTGYSECEDVCNGFPGALLDEATCTITYSATQGVGKYIVAVQIEDFATQVSTTALSSIPLQFMVIVFSAVPAQACDSVTIVSPTEASFTAVVGLLFTVSITAQAVQSITKIDTIKPVGMVAGPLTTSSDASWFYASKAVTWTPTQSDAGTSNTLCFSATDSLGLISPVKCVSIEVPIPIAPTTPTSIDLICYPNATIIVQNKLDYTQVFAMEISNYKICTTNWKNGIQEAVEIIGCDLDTGILVHFSNRTIDPNTDLALTDGYNFILNCNNIDVLGIAAVDSNALGVSLVTEDKVSATPSFYVYSALRNSGGAEVFTADIGDTLTWTIDIPDEYSLMPVTCKAYSGTGNTGPDWKEIISDGCTQDISLVESFDDVTKVNASSDLKTYFTDFHVFKFYNSDDIYIECQIKVCPPGVAVCDIACPNAKRRRRTVFNDDGRVSYIASSDVLHVRGSLFGKSTKLAPAWISCASILYILSTIWTLNGSITTIAWIPDFD